MLLAKKSFFRKESIPLSQAHCVFKKKTGTFPISVACIIAGDSVLGHWENNRNVFYRHERKWNNPESHILKK